LAAPGAELRFTLRNFSPCQHQQALARTACTSISNCYEHHGNVNTEQWLETPAWQDLRLHDNETLVAAARDAKAGGGQLAFVYVHSPDEDGDDPATGVGAQHQPWHLAHLRVQAPSACQWAHIPASRVAPACSPAAACNLKSSLLRYCRHLLATGRSLSVVDAPCSGSPRRRPAAALRPWCRHRLQVRSRSLGALLTWRCSSWYTGWHEGQAIHNWWGAGEVHIWMRSEMWQRRSMLRQCSIAGDMSLPCRQVQPFARHSGLEYAT
jgi:hypothetical protein